MVFCVPTFGGTTLKLRLGNLNALDNGDRELKQQGGLQSVRAMAITLGWLSVFSLISQMSFLESRSRVREPPTNKAAWTDSGIKSNKLNKLE